MEDIKNRFRFKSSDDLSDYRIDIIVDDVTGVNYLIVKNENGTGITPLLAKDGSIVIDR